MTAQVRAALREYLQALHWERARQDVEPFLERNSDLQMVSKEWILPLLAPGASNASAARVENL